MLKIRVAKNCATLYSLSSGNEFSAESVFHFLHLLSHLNNCAFNTVVLEGVDLLNIAPFVVHCRRLSIDASSLLRLTPLTDSIIKPIEVATHMECSELEEIMLGIIDASPPCTVNLNVNVRGNEKWSGSYR